MIQCHSPQATLADVFRVSGRVSSYDAKAYHHSDDTEIKLCHVTRFDFEVATSSHFATHSPTLRVRGMGRLISPPRFLRHGRSHPHSAPFPHPCVTSTRSGRETWRRPYPLVQTQASVARRLMLAQVSRMSRSIMWPVSHHPPAMAPLLRRASVGALGVMQLVPPGLGNVPGAPPTNNGGSSSSVWTRRP